MDLEPPIEEEAAEGTKVADVPSKEQADEDDDEEADPVSPPSRGVYKELCTDDLGMTAG